jgi:hypothetical protein
MSLDETQLNIRELLKATRALFSICMEEVEESDKTILPEYERILRDTKSALDKFDEVTR